MVKGVQTTGIHSPAAITHPPNVCRTLSSVMHPVIRTSDFGRWPPPSLWMPVMLFPVLPCLCALLVPDAVRSVQSGPLTTITKTIIFNLFIPAGN